MLKGQVISSDFIASLVLFMAALSLFLYFSYVNEAEVVTKTYANNLKDKALKIKHDVLYYTGYPVSWTPSNVLSYGFADERNVINATKLHYLSLIDYEDMKNYYLIEKGEFFVNVSYVNGTPYFYYGVAPMGSLLIVKSRGYGLIDGNVVLVEVYAWQ